MKTSVAGTRLAAPVRLQTRTRVTAPVAATLRQEVARVAKGTGLGLAALGLALSAQAATVKAGKDGGGLEFDPNTVTIKAGESVTWVNNVGFPHNVVFDEDDVPVSGSLSVLRVGRSVQPVCAVCRNLLSACVGGSRCQQPVPRGLLERSRTEGHLKVLQARLIWILL